MLPATATPTTASAAPWPIPPVIGASIGLHVSAAVGATLWPAAWPWAVAALALNHAVLSTVGLIPRSTWLGPNVRRLPDAAARRGDVAITLDDGPDAEVTPAILDLLAEQGVRATFFCIAERARARPALVRRIVAAGHSVQNHSARHRHNFSLLGPRGLEREVGDAQKMLSDLTGVQPHCFRAPAGLRNPMLDPVLHRMGLHLVSWSRRGYDTYHADPAVVLNRLRRGLSGGSILLLHDGHARSTVQGRPVLLAVLPALLAQCAQLGLRPVTLSEALPPRGA